MKLIFVLLLFSLSAFAKTLICQQNPRDVRLELKLDKDIVRLSVFSPMGYSYLPMFESPVTPSQLGFFKYQIDQLKKLDQYFWVEWKAENCRYEIEKHFKQTKLECSKSEKSSVEDYKFLTFTISTLTDDSFAGTWRSLRFRMSVSASSPFGEEAFFLAIPVYEQACVVI